MQVDLSALPPPDIIETIDFESILADHKAELVSRYPDIAETIDLESEPALKLLEVGAYRELKLRARYNDEARALLLALATGTDLDHIGVSYYQEPRLIITPEDLTTTPTTPSVMETDDDYRYRLSLKPESFSVAGPRDAFKFHALSAHGQVKDANPISPYRGTTEVFVLSRTGSGVPDVSLLSAVSSRLNDETIRPLSEEVLVSPCSVIEYTIDISLKLYPGAVSEIAIAAANTALIDFATAQHKIDGDIVLSAIDAAAHQAGVKEVIIHSPPAKVVCDYSQAPFCTGITIRPPEFES